MGRSGLATAFLILALIFFAVGCAPHTGRSSSAAPYPHAVVATSHPAASQAGAEMLHLHHGNAVDAAVATAFALSVTRPASCGIGGGGFMVIHFDHDPRFGTRSIALNYREPAPAAVNGPDYFQRLERDRGLAEAATRGATSVGVPSSVAGLLYALEHYGTLDRKTVLTPAIRLAEEGFVVDEEYARVAAQQIEPYRNDPARQQRFAFVWERFLRSGQVKVGDRIAVPEQAEALRLIAEGGAEAFYSGPIAQAILDAVRADGGAAHLTAEDLRTAHYVESVEPLRFTARGRTFITMPPPSSGGVALAETYGILDRVAAYPPQLKQGARRIHLEVEAMKHAFADRATYLADPNFSDVPVKRLMSDDYLKTLASRVDPYRTLPSDRYGSAGTGAARNDAGTCHLSVVDAHGNAVSCTETIFTGFGSHLAVAKYGFVLNNTLGAFTQAGGEANVMKLVQADGNLPGPGKRALASMTPTIALDGKGRVQLVAGASGGPRIISATFQAIDAVVSDNLSAADAVAKPRFHHQWQPDELLLEKPLMEDTALVESLRRCGHNVKPVASIAKVQLIRRHPGGRGWDAACDPRDGISTPAGF